MIINCPNCHNNVLPTKDNLCPTCKKSTKGCAESKMDKASIKITIDDTLPSKCIFCGNDSASGIKLQWERDPAEGSSGWYHRWLFKFFVGGLLGKLIAKKFKVGKDIFALNLPVCMTCKEGQTVQVNEIDWENRGARVLVDLRFKKIFENEGRFAICPRCEVKVSTKGITGREVQCPFCEKKFTF
jgi:hypothetical protein